MSGHDERQHRRHLPYRSRRRRPADPASVLRMRYTARAGEGRRGHLEPGTHKWTLARWTCTSARACSHGSASADVP